MHHAIVVSLCALLATACNADPSTAAGALGADIKPAAKANAKPTADFKMDTPVAKPAAKTELDVKLDAPAAKPVATPQLEMKMDAPVAKPPTRIQALVGEDGIQATNK